MLKRVRKKHIDRMLVLLLVTAINLNGIPALAAAETLPYAPGTVSDEETFGGSAALTAGQELYTADSGANSILKAQLLSTENNITSFMVPNQSGNMTISLTNHTVTFHMPYGTDAANLAPIVEVSPGATVSPVSGTARDFTTEQTYTVTAQNGEYQEWTAICAVDRNTAADIIEFTVPGQLGTSTIDTTNHTIIFQMPVGMPVSALTPTVQVSPEAAVSPVSGAAMDFSRGQTYTVTAQDGTTQLWKVTCSTANSIVGFSVPNQIGGPIIDEANSFVYFYMPEDIDMTNLRPAVKVWPGATLTPESGEIQNFDSTETPGARYTVTSPEGTPRDWRVFRSYPPVWITGFTVPNQVGSTFIDKDNYQVTFYMPSGSDVTNLRPTVSVTTGTSFYTGEFPNQNYGGLLPDNFSSPVKYFLEAFHSDGSYALQLWTATCIITENNANITGFNVPNQVGAATINAGNHHMPYGSNVTALTPTVTVPSGATAASIYPQPLKAA